MKDNKDQIHLIKVYNLKLVKEINYQPDEQFDKQQELVDDR